MSSLNPAQDALGWESKVSANQPRRPRTWQSYLAIVSMIVPALALLVLGLIAGQPPADGDIERGVAIGGVEMDGTSWEDARAAVGVLFRRLSPDAQ